MMVPTSKGFQVTTERHRLLAAVARILARDGLHAATTATIADEAGVVPSALEAEFGDVPGCVIAATLVLVHQAYSVALDAYDREDLWPDGVREALRALLDFLSVEPDFVRAGLVELRYIPGTDRHLAAARELFTAFLTPGHDADATLPLLTAEMISGGVLQLITRHAFEHRVAELPAALAELTELVLSAYLPADEVREAVRQC